MTILARKFNKIILLKFHTKTHVLNLMHFQEVIVIFFLKNEALRSKSVNIPKVQPNPNNFIFQRVFEENMLLKTMFSTFLA